MCIRDRLLIDGLGSLKGTGTSDQGLCTLPDGKQCYEAFLKKSIGTDRSVDELVQLATSQIISDMKEMKNALPASQMAEDVVLQESSPESIPDAVQLPNHPLRLFQLFFFQNGIDRHIDSRIYSGAVFL